MRKKALFILVAIVSVVSLALVACNQAATPTTTAPPATTAPTATTKPPSPTTTAPAPTTVSPDAAKYGGIFKRVMTAGASRPIGYPAEAANDSYTWASPVLDRLLSVNLAGKILPELAVSWNVGADGKSLVLGLRKGVKFHDGSDFNAAVCKWNLDMQIAAKKTTDFTSVDIIDDYTIRLTIPSYKNTLLATLAGGMTQQISKASFDKNGAEWARWNPVGTGPFIFVEYKRDSEMTLKKNPNYWEPGKPYLDGVVVNVIADSTVRKLAFEKGDIHKISSSGVDAQDLQKKGFEMVTEPGGTFALIPDSKTTASPWANINVRLAASYALDREALAKALSYGFSKPAYQVYPSFAQTAIPNLVKHNYDPAKAKALLRDAGYPTGFKTVMHVFSVISKDYSSAVANLLRAVGIDIEVDNPTSGKYTELRYGTWDGVMNHALNTYSNYASIADYWLATQFPTVKLPAGFREGLEAAAATKEPDPKLIQTAMSVMYDDVMVIPYIEEMRVTFLQKGVHDPGTLTTTLTTNVDKEVWLEPSARK